MEDKKCRKCGFIKPLSEFYSHPDTLDHHLSTCKECCKAANRDNRNKNLEHYRQYDRDRNKANGNREKCPYSVSNPEKYRTRYQLRNAVKLGVITRPNVCSVCGVHSDQIEAHHSDYSKPLDVIWVCKECHWKIHKMINKQERLINHERTRKI